MSKDNETRKLMIRRKPPKGKKSFWKTGRSSEYYELPMDQIKFMVTKGFSETDIRECFKIEAKIWHNWKDKHPEFMEHLADWRQEYDRKIEKALAERAIGYKHKEEKVFCYNGKIVTHEVEKQYPPDVAAAALWLTNRKPQEWKRQEYTAKVQAGIEVNINRPHVVDLTDFSEEELQLIARAGKKLSMLKGENSDCVDISRGDFLVEDMPEDMPEDKISPLQIERNAGIE